MFTPKKYNTIENLYSIIIALVMSLIVIWSLLWKGLIELEEKPKRTFLVAQVESIPEEEVKEFFKKENAGVASILDTVTDKLRIDIKPGMIALNTSILNSYVGIAYGPSGKETYYNLPMQGVINIMRSKGYTEEDYPYIVREDGVKCLGDYVIVAGNLEKYYRGQIIETTLGQGIVCDTGEAMMENPDIIDIAVDW